uniref:Uncharacterized protein n=1 Tax=Oryza brachyantha TaxID=4533 RepID=J3M951_ORYBR
MKKGRKRSECVRGRGGFLPDFRRAADRSGGGRGDEQELLALALALGGGGEGAGRCGGAVRCGWGAMVRGGGGGVIDAPVTGERRGEGEVEVEEEEDELVLVVPHAGPYLPGAASWRAEIRSLAVGPVVERSAWRAVASGSV